MTDFTIDTTVLAKGMIPPRRRKKDPLFEEQSRIHDLARAILQDVENSVLVMHVPSAALIEIAAVASRLTGEEKRGMQAYDYVRKHGNVVYDSSLLEEAVRIAAKTKISGFDSVFIACAKETRSVLVTDDKGMYEAAVKWGIESRLLRDMETR